MEADSAYRALHALKHNTVRDITLDCSISHKSEHMIKQQLRYNNVGQPYEQADAYGANRGHSGGYFHDAYAGRQQFAAGPYPNSNVQRPSSSHSMHISPPQAMQYPAAMPRFDHNLRGYATPPGSGSLNAPPPPPSSYGALRSQHLPMQQPKTLHHSNSSYSVTSPVELHAQAYDRYDPRFPNNSFSSASQMLPSGSGSPNSHGTSNVSSHGPVLSRMSSTSSNFADGYACNPVGYMTGPTPKRMEPSDSLANDVMGHMSVSSMSSQMSSLLSTSSSSSLPSTLLPTPISTAHQQRLPQHGSFHWPTVSTDEYGDGTPRNQDHYADPYLRSLNSMQSSASYMAGAPSGTAGSATTGVFGGGGGGGSNMLFKSAGDTTDGEQEDSNNSFNIGFLGSALQGLSLKKDADLPSSRNRSPPLAASAGSQVYNPSSASPSVGTTTLPDHSLGGSNENSGHTVSSLLSSVNRDGLEGPLEIPRLPSPSSRLAW